MGEPIERFEDILAWQKARDFTREIYRVTETGRFARDYGLKNQIRRSSVSIMSNIAEGFERGRPKEFQQFLSISKGSCGETRSHLYVAVDVGYINRERFHDLMTQGNEVARIVGGLRSSIERNPHSGF